MTEPTIKQWKRRALVAEDRAESIQQMRAAEHATELRQYRQLAACRVALKEAQEAIAWALQEQIHE